MLEMSSNNAAAMAPFFKAFSEAQSEINNVLAEKDGHKYKYAELHQVLAAVRAPFAKNGLAVMQLPSSETTENGIIRTSLITMITHESGEWIRSSMNIDYNSKAGMSEIQVLGSHITYARRYMLSAIAGISQVDDESDLSPTAQAENSKIQDDIERLKLSGLRAAKDGREALEKWYRTLKVGDKNFLKNDESGIKLMAEISSTIEA